MTSHAVRQILTYFNLFLTLIPVNKTHSCGPSHAKTSQKLRNKKKKKKKKKKQTKQKKKKTFILGFCAFEYTYLCDFNKQEHLVHEE